MIERLRMPTAEKMHRGRLTIEALQKEIYIFGYLFVGREPFKMYPNWRTDYTDYKQMLRAARGITGRGIHTEVDASGFGGEAGSQFIVGGRITQKGRIDVFGLVDRAAANIAAREQKTKVVSEEEMHRIFKEAELAGADIDRVWEEKVIPRLPRSVEQIRFSIVSKIMSTYWR